MNVTNHDDARILYNVSTQLVVEIILRGGDVDEIEVLLDRGCTQHWDRILVDK